MSHADLDWKSSYLGRFHRGLGARARAIHWTGGAGHAPTGSRPATWRRSWSRVPLEVRVDDLRAVVDAAGSEHAVVFGSWETGLSTAMFAAAAPERTSGLEYLAWSLPWTRAAMAPGALVAERYRFASVDIRGALPAIQAPTVEVSNADDEVSRPPARLLAGRIAGAGIAVHIGANVGAMAGPGEVWASPTVKDLTAGSGLVLEDRGEHEPKGVPDQWRLFRVAS